MGSFGGTQMMAVSHRHPWQSQHGNGHDFGPLYTKQALTSIPISNPPPSPAIPMAEGADHAETYTLFQHGITHRNDMVRHRWRYFENNQTRFSFVKKPRFDRHQLTARFTRPCFPTSAFQHAGNQTTETPTAFDDFHCGHCYKII